MKDIADPNRLFWSFTVLVQPRFDPEETAARQVERLGFEREDVRHIVLTHLDQDHTGGVADFPRARVHVFEREYAAATHPRTIRERFICSPVQWVHGPDWVFHDLQGERWFGFDCVRVLPEVSPEVLLVPLPGHTRGHCGVAVREPDRWLFDCGDAWAYDAENPYRPRRSLTVRFFRQFLDVDAAATRRAQVRLQALVRDHASEVYVCNAHGLVAFSELQGGDTAV